MVDIRCGVGWFKEEFDVFGVLFEWCVECIVEYVVVMCILWCDDVVLFDGNSWVVIVVNCGWLWFWLIFRLVMLMCL